jgi:membrane-bound metal-dependent hydrolase YbcI (DUF457 family)
MALAYLLGRGSSVALHTKINIPLILLLSILPDVDIFYDLLTGANIHRGPTHSIVVATVIFIPLFIYFGKRAIPYFLALISHSLIGDFLIGGQIEMFWPLSTLELGLHEIGGPFIRITGFINTVAEMLLFAGATAVLFFSGDWRTFLEPHKSNLLLIVPIVTVLLPSTIGYPFEYSLLQSQQWILAYAHLFYLVLFLIAIVAALIHMYKQLMHVLADK